MKIERIISGLCAMVVIVALCVTCGKEELPPNPYDDIKITVTPPPVDTNSPYSIQWLHKNIFNPKCNNPSCHDGNFEPDFRTIQSSYSTMVYQKVKKNNPQGSFVYRVKPYDTLNSWLHERLVTDDPDLGQMPLYGNPLSQNDMDKINGWIMNGAQDMFGTPASQASLPNAPPMVNGYGAFVGNVQVDTLRQNGLIYYPFQIPAATQMIMAFAITDDSTAISSLTINQLKISTQKDDFSQAITLPCTYLNLQPGEIYYTPVDCSVLPKNQVLYFRYYVGDGNPNNNVEFPNNASPDYYKTYYAMIVY